MIFIQLITCKCSAGLKGITCFLSFWSVLFIKMQTFYLFSHCQVHLQSHTDACIWRHTVTTASWQEHRFWQEQVNLLTELLGKMGRSSWLLLFPSWFPSDKYQQSDLGRVRRPWCYFIALPLGVLWVCVYSPTWAAVGRQVVWLGVHLFTQVGEKGGGITLFSDGRELPLPPFFRDNSHLDWIFFIWF